MALFNSKYENAARVLAESDDEVLQAAGMMAQMRLETLKLRLKGWGSGTKALTWPTSSFVQPRFNFGIPAHYNNSTNRNMFGQPLHSGVFGSSTGFQPPLNSANGVTFGSTAGSHPQAFGSGTQPQAFGATGFGSTPGPFSTASGANASGHDSVSQPQSFGFGSNVSSTGDAAPQSSSAFGSTTGPQPQPFGSANGAGFGTTSGFQSQVSANGFGGANSAGPQTSVFGSGAGSQPQAFGSATGAIFGSTTGSPPSLFSSQSQDFGLTNAVAPGNRSLDSVTSQVQPFSQFLKKVHISSSSDTATTSTTSSNVQNIYALAPPTSEELTLGTGNVTNDVTTNDKSNAPKE